MTPSHGRTIARSEGPWHTGGPAHQRPRSPSHPRSRGQCIWWLRPCSCRDSTRSPSGSVRASRSPSSCGCGTRSRSGWHSRSSRRGSAGASWSPGRRRSSFSAQPPCSAGRRCTSWPCGSFPRRDRGDRVRGAAHHGRAGRRGARVAIATDVAATSVRKWKYSWTHSARVAGSRRPPRRRLR